MKASCILCICSMLLSLPSVIAQEIVELGEYGKVRVAYILVSSKMPERAKQIANMGGVVDMNQYPDGQLAIKVEVLDLKNKYTLYLGPQSLPTTLHGFVRAGSWKPSLKKGDRVTVKYNYAPDRLDESKAVMTASFYVKDKQGNILGNTDGYHARGQSYRLIPPDATPRPDRDAIDSEAAAWETASKANTVAAYSGFLNVFPNGQYAKEAKRKLAALQAPPSAPSEAKPSPSPSLTDAVGNPEEEKGSLPSNSKRSTDSLSATYKIEGNGGLRIQIQGGQPPFELRFLQGKGYAGIIRLGGKRDIGLTHEQVTAGGILPGSYQLEVYDKVGGRHNAAACPQPYELPKAASRLPRWLLLAFAVAAVFYLGYYVGGRRGG